MKTRNQLKSIYDALVGHFDLAESLNANLHGRLSCRQPATGPVRHVMVSSWVELRGLNEAGGTNAV